MSKARLPMSEGVVQRIVAGMLPWTIALATGLEYFDNALFPFFISHMASGLHAAPDKLIWASSAYTAAAILGILRQQWWVEHIGYRRYFSACLLLFGVGSLACALSAGPVELAIARGFQGYFIGPLMGACRILLKVDLAPARQAFATRLFVFFILFGTAIAPLAGGYLVAWFGWRFLFVGTAALALVLSVLAYMTVADTGHKPAEERGAPHVWLYVVFALAQSALQIVLQQARFHQAGVWSSPLLLTLLALGGLGLLCWFAWHQWRHPRPLVRLHGLREQAFRTGIVLYVFFYVTNTALNYLIFGVLEGDLGYPVERAGRIVGLTALTALAAMFIYFPYSPSIAFKKRLIVPGFGIAALIAVWLASVSAHTDVAWLAPPLFLRGLLLFCIALPVASGTFGVFAPDEFNHGYRFKNIVKQMANSFATVGIIMFEQHRQAFHTMRLADSAAIVANAELGRLALRQAHALSLIDSCWIVALIAAMGGLFTGLQRWIR
jgi:MFS family permease